MAPVYEMGSGIRDASMALDADPIDWRISGSLYYYLMLRSGNPLRAKWREVPKLLLFGVIGFAGVQTSYFYSIARLPVSIALILEFTSPLWIALWLRYVRKRQVARTMWIGLAFAFLGLILLAQVWKGLTLNGPGVLGALASAFCLTLYFLMSKGMSSSRTSGEILTWGWVSQRSSTRSSCRGGATRLITSQRRLSSWVASKATMHLVGSLVASVIIFGTVVPYSCVMAGIIRTTASTGSVIGMLEPVMAGAFAWVLLGERFNVIQLIGAVVVLVGIAVADRASSHNRVNCSHGDL
jgi:drug/metabolite transporter (DMT)-like permease